jgi:hypothetical protein
MALVRGPFILKWGDNVISDVEEISVEHEIDSEDYQTVQGRTLEIDGAYKTTCTLTLLATDIAALAAVLPQHFVANGGVMSTGETVNTAQGAIDVAPAACTDAIVYNNLDIISCGNNAVVARIVNARTKMDGVEMDSKLQKIMVKFVGEAAINEATIQFFIENSIAVVS